MFPALVVCDQRFPWNCSEHFQISKITKWSTNGKNGPWNWDTGVQVNTPGESSVCSMFLLSLYKNKPFSSPHDSWDYDLLNSVNVGCDKFYVKVWQISSNLWFSVNTPQKHDNHHTGMKDVELGVFLWEQKNLIPTAQKPQQASRSQPIRIRRNSESYKATL